MAVPSAGEDEDEGLTGADDQDVVLLGNLIHVARRGIESCRLGKRRASISTEEKRTTSKRWEACGFGPVLWLMGSCFGGPAQLEGLMKRRGFGPVMVSVRCGELALSIT